MPTKRKNYRNIIKKIAYNRMLYLFQEAHKSFPEKKELANRYVYLASRYAQRAKIKIPYEWRTRICKKCRKFLYPGLNYRIRMQSRKGKGSHISLTCFECGKTTRYFVKLKNKKLK